MKKFSFELEKVLDIAISEQTYNELRSVIVDQ